MRLDSGLPLWVRAAEVLGVPSLIAIGLIWWITMTMGAGLLRTEQKLDAHEMQRFRDMQQMNSFLYAICLNTAGNDLAMARCAVALDGALTVKGR